MARSRLLPVGALTIAMSAVVGGVMGRSVAASQDRLTENYRTFTAALTVIEARYVDKVESDRLVYGAISGMLQTLDPHSNFMDPQAYAQLRERQEGRYYGLGITISVVDGDITVVSLFEGSPAYKQGIRRGDIIAKIDRRGREGLDDGTGGAQAARPEGHDASKSRIKRPGNEGLIQRSQSSARRDQHSDDSRRVHARRADRLRPPAGLRREHRSRSRAARSQRSARQGHEAPAARHARQSRAGRSIRRSAWPTASCRRAT